MKKHVVPSELAYVLGLVITTAGIAFAEHADFGLSMIAAPAYILHLKLSELSSFFTFGTANYCFQGLLLIIVAALAGRFRFTWFLSFLTAFLSGTLLDLMLVPVALLPAGTVRERLIWYVIGMLLGSVGISMMFRTYFAPEVYELFVKVLSERFGIGLAKFKTGYDCASLLLGIILSFSFFGFGCFEGVKWGTVVCALVNGRIIGACSRFYDRKFEFRDFLPLRKYFE